MKAGPLRRSYGWPGVGMRSCGARSYNAAVAVPIAASNHPARHRVGDIMGERVRRAETDTAFVRLLRQRSTDDTSAEPTNWCCSRGREHPATLHPVPLERVRADGRCVGGPKPNARPDPPPAAQHAAEAARSRPPCKARWAADRRSIRSHSHSSTPFATARGPSQGATRCCHSAGSGAGR